MPLLITLLLGLFFLAGALINRLTHRHGTVEHISISIACGAMIALLCFDLIPEILEEYDSTSWWKAAIFVIMGMAILKLIDRFVPEHGHHDEHGHDNSDAMVHIGIMAALAICLHNILEGMTVYGIASLDSVSGVTLAFGVGLHNIPMGMLILAMLMKKRGWLKYLIITLMVASTFVGGLIMMTLSGLVDVNILNALICITMGMVLFIIIFELLPAIINNKNIKRSLICFAIGFVLVALSSLL